jgi:hypothetical protein
MRFLDNTACIEWENNVIGGREHAKHIAIRKHFAHEVIQNGYMKLDLSWSASLLGSPASIYKLSRGAFI